MPINVPPKAQGAFGGNMDTGAKIELPFPAPAFYVLNGDAKMEELKNVMYYGGWASSIANLKAASEQWENCPYPIPSYQEKELRLKKETIPSVVARALIVAPIGIRQFSTIKSQDGNTKRVAPYTKGARPAIQVLCYLGYRNEQKQIMPWAPIMLTAKGFQVNHVQKAFGDWKKAITPFMAEIAPGMPADVTNLFWMHIGTFGNTRHEEPHGESVITPVSAYIPEDLTAAKVENMYVGDPMAEFMADMSVKSAEWMKAYAKLTPATAVPDEPEMGEVPPPDEDLIPF